MSSLSLVSQSPSLRGSGRFETSAEEAARDQIKSQSPSLRGSGRFEGAGAGGGRRPWVSIPFIAGQWSLPLELLYESLRKYDVSIPFIAGQWSLHSGAHCRPWPLSGVSIPFIAGQWSLPPAVWQGGRGLRGVSIPFIAGQWSLHPDGSGGVDPAPVSQSPSLRGSGRFGGTSPDPDGSGGVSIPFIAGQWSLPARRRGAPALPSARLNPLHCGAVVASRRMEQSMRVCSSLNPLHCGAVVASALARLRDQETKLVSIPFIAGQWSLLRTSPTSFGRSWTSQSPSLRGSGRFAQEEAR